jgi:two-component system, oxyanion-binding sensor
MTLSIDFGFVALTDAAPLIVAKEHGLFAKEGLAVALHREVSWATIRDKVAASLFHGAHMLAPLAIAARIGAGSEPAGVIAPMSLNTQSATIGVSSQLATEMQDDSAASLAQAVAMRLDAQLHAARLGGGGRARSVTSALQQLRRLPLPAG